MYMYILSIEIRNEYLNYHEYDTVSIFMWYTSGVSIVSLVENKLLFACILVCSHANTYCVIQCVTTIEHVRVWRVSVSTCTLILITACLALLALVTAVALVLLWRGARSRRQVHTDPTAPAVIATWQKRLGMSWPRMFFIMHRGPTISGKSELFPGYGTGTVHGTNNLSICSNDAWI